MFMNEALRQSDKVKRTDWGEGQFIVKDDVEGCLLWHSNGIDQGGYQPTIADVMADDWKPIIPVPDFYEDIQRFNSMYKLTCNEKPTLRPVDSLKNFKSIIEEEIAEIDEIIAKQSLMAGIKTLTPSEKIEIIADVADWLGDVIVYCNTYALSWGLPMKEILAIIMQSNFSKLGEDGEPIYDSRGKVEKGPNYWKPEPKLRELLESKLRSKI